MSDKALLVTIPFSHYCEKARWALERGGVAFDETGHLPLMHVLPVLRYGGRRQVPVLVADGKVIADSTKIMRWVDARVPDAKRLFPADTAREAEVCRWEDRFDDVLGPHARRWGYAYLLPDRARTTALMERNVPAWEHLALRLGYPVAKAIMTRALKVSPEGRDRSAAKIDELFAAVGDALADGRAYLTGDQFTAADLAFAALATPVLLPPQHERYLGGVGDVPPAMVTAVQRWRDTPAGRFGLRLYARDR